LCHWEQRTGGNPKLVGMSENIRSMCRGKRRVLR